MLHGQRIGAVTGVTLIYDKTEDDVSVAVRYEVEPDRVSGLNLPEGDELDKSMMDMVRRGLRIRLESASLVTGSQQLTMDIVPGAPEAAYAKDGDAYVLPPLDPGQADIGSSAGALIARLQKIPFEEIGDNLNKTLSGASDTVNNPKLRQAIAALNETLTSAQTLLASVNKDAGPALHRLPQIAADLEGTVQHANQLVGSLDDSHGGSQFGRDLSRMLSQLSDAARSVRILADLLSRHPEALIRGQRNKRCE